MKNRSKNMLINSAAVNLCTTIMVAPQRGQCQTEEPSAEALQGPASTSVEELLDSRCRDRAKREARKRLARKPNGRAKDDICTTMYVYNDITQSGRRGREGTANLPYLGRLKPIPISSTSWITGNRADVGVRCPQT